MICKVCGTEVDAGNACAVCGTMAEAAEMEVVETVETVETVECECEAAPAKNPGKVLGIVALILGILAILLSLMCSCLGCFLGGSLCVSLLNPSLLVGIGGLICGIIGSKKSKAAGFKNTLALVGTILSGAAVGIGLISMILDFVMWLLSTVLNIGFNFIPAFNEGFNQGYNQSYYGY